MADVISKVDGESDVKNGGAYINPGGDMSDTYANRTLEDRIYDGPEPTAVENKYTGRFLEG